MLLSRRHLMYLAATGLTFAVAASGLNLRGCRGNRVMHYRGVVYDVGLKFTEGQPYSVDLR